MSRGDIRSLDKDPVTISSLPTHGLQDGTARTEHDRATPVGTETYVESDEPDITAGKGYGVASDNHGSRLYGV